MKRPIEDCSGRCLRQEIRADRPAPPFDRVMMDGIAIRYRDFRKDGTVFRITGLQGAGEVPLELKPGTEASCIEIMTGAVLPRGADTVIPYEEIDISDGRAVISSSTRIEEGQYIHRKGTDCPSGTVLVEPGCRLGSLEITAAASCGYDTLLVDESPCVAIISTGDELVPVSEQPDSHQIRMSNGYALSTAVENAGFKRPECIHLTDDELAAESVFLETMERNDIIITTGAVSMGKHDFIPDLLGRLGCDRHFHGIAQRPGKPMGFWRHPSPGFIFTLPGNPMSTLVCFHRYVYPALRIFCGFGNPIRETVRLAHDLTMETFRASFLPVVLDEKHMAVVQSGKNSGDYIRCIKTNGFIELEKGKHDLSVGSELTFYRWF